MPRLAPPLTGPLLRRPFRFLTRYAGAGAVAAGLDPGVYNMLWDSPDQMVWGAGNNMIWTVS